jgi:hypothetical protein
MPMLVMLGSVQGAWEFERTALPAWTLYRLCKKKK